MAVGHDPRLRESHTIARAAFFADYYFKPIPRQGGERAKYDLAAKIYAYVGALTNHKYRATEIVLTNLCNDALPHAPKGKIVYIPEAKAIEGLRAVEDLLSQTQVEIVFAMSEQVNYWLQKLGFYQGVDSYLAGARPTSKGALHSPPYYEPARGRAFLEICGKQFRTRDSRIVCPILHVKNWPLRPALERAYGRAYESCINGFK